MGSALRIPFASTPDVGSKVKATIRYKTTDGCTALQWLDKECVRPLIQSHFTSELVLTSFIFEQADAGQEVPILVQSMPTHLRTESHAHTGHAVRESRELVLSSSLYVVTDNSVASTRLTTRKYPPSCPP